MLKQERLALARKEKRDSKESKKPHAARQEVIRWSYSSWSQMQSCGFAYYCKFILGMKEDRPPGPALIRGIEAHKMQEGYLKGDIQGVPKILKPFEPHLKQLKRLSPTVEKFWGVDQQWKPKDYGSWVVMKMDAAVPPCAQTDNILFIQDLKTGRKYDDHYKQGSLYAAIGNAIYPKNDGIEVEFWYADMPPGENVAQWSFNTKQVKKLVNVWKARGEDLLTVRSDDYYLPSPSHEKCRWCFLDIEKGGPCGAYKRWKQAGAR